MNAWGHFKTITHHKLLVMQYCFRVGLIRQGLLHDLSKYSPTEFRIGMKYYSGTRSPNASERDEIGYSTAWMHHKGRNKHHLEYWVDYVGKDMVMTGNPMPTRYMVELCLDRIAACRVYHGDKYTDRDPLDYLNHSKDSKMMHPATKRQVVEILTMLGEKGEKETLRYLRKVVLKNPQEIIPNLPNKTGDPSEKDQLFIEPEALKRLTEEIPTPFYLYSETEIRERLRRVSAAFAWNPNYRQFFPVKATPTAGILKLIREEGHGVVCSSAAELILCQRCGFQPEEILFLPNFPREEDLKTARDIGCMPILDGEYLIDDFREYGLLGETVGLRVKANEYFRFGETEAEMDSVKFGFTPEQVKSAIPKLKALGVTKIGLHAYLSGNTLSPEYYEKLTAFLCKLAGEVALPVAYINISGGLGIAYRPGETEPDIESLGQKVKSVFQSHVGGETGLYTELGRFITGPAGILVTRVQHIKEAGRRYAGVDASASDLMRPMMYGAYHHISLVGADPAVSRERWDIVGAVCENTDKFAENRMLPQLHEGDLLAIHDAGAHGHSMGYQYGGRLRCGEYLLHADGSVSLLRRKETVEDYITTQVF